MKKSVLTITISGLFIASLMFTSCGGKKEQTMEKDHQHMEGDTTKHHDEMKMDSTKMAYVCPMHPEEIGKEGDKCSKCGMNLAAMKSADSTATHNH